MHVLIDLEVQSQAVSRALLSLKSLGAGPSLRVRQSLAFLSVWLQHSTLPPLSHGGLLTVCLSAQTSPFVLRTLVIELRPTLIQWASQVVLVVKNPGARADVRHASSIPGSERCPGVGNGNPPQCS